MSASGKPYLVSPAGESTPLVRLTLEGRGVGPSFSEDDLQGLLHKHPEILPCADIDPAYQTVVPLCREMKTASGYVDLVGVTPLGNLVVIETKLWRNPQARREVVAQILDYAKDLARWNYSDLEREVKKVTGEDRRSLYERVAAVASVRDEVSFCDQVARQLRTGQFLLLVVGDGIREGVSDVTEFLENYGSLQFAFGLMEVGVFEMPDGGRLFSASVVAKTALLKRVVLVPRLVDGVDDDTAAEDGATEEDSDIVNGPDPDKASKSDARLAFWTKLINGLEFDDVRQPLPTPSRRYNIFLPMPPAGGGIRVSAYLGASADQIGVYMNGLKSSIAEPVWEILRRDADSIIRELGFEVAIVEHKPLVIIMDKLGDMSDPANEERVLRFFREKLNRFVSVFRPRLERIAEELQLK